MMNRRNSLKAGVLICLFTISGCRDAFSPVVNNYQDKLVVDGLISNEPGPYTVKLSVSSPVNKPSYKPLSDCNVFICSKNGDTAELTETSPGEYNTLSNGIRGQVGQSYALKVITPQGKHYQTPFTEMLPPVGIDTVIAELEFKENNNYARPLGGYQFYLTTENVFSNNYFLWRLEETYEFHSQYKIHMIFRGMGLEPFFNRDSLYYCWKTRKVPEFFTGSTINIGGERLINEPIHFVNTETKRLQVRYSLLVKQYSISAEAYYYWKELQEQIEGDDFLISSQPYQITGNLVSEEHSDERALGYFTVGSVQKKRYFFDKPDTEFHYVTCIANPDLTALAYLPPSQYPVYITVTDEGFAMASNYCFDCTLWGGSLDKPDYWIDKPSKQK